MLCFTVLNVACSRKSGNTPNQFYGLAIGFVIIAGGYGAGAISGGAFNPAVAIGADLVSIGLGFGWSVYYVAFEYLGALIAALLFRIIRPDEFNGLYFAASRHYGLQPRFMSEFVGTFVLVLTVCLNVLGGSVATAWSVTAALLSMIYSLADVSGAQF